MATNTENNLIRGNLMYSGFSCIYTSLILFILFYFDIVYSIGKRTCWPLILNIVLAEFFKLSFNTSIQTVAANRDKHFKGKKNIVKSKFKNVLVILVMIIVYYVIAVLFGAPFLEHQEETLMFSLLLTCLTVIPSCLNLGADNTIAMLTNIAAYQSDLIAEVIKRSICLTLFGAWLGAIVIPLDWDREWQVWPIPCCIGAILGYISSHVINSLSLLSSKVATAFVKKTGKYGL